MPIRPIPSPRPRMRIRPVSVSSHEVPPALDQESDSAPRQRKREPNRGSFPPGVSGNRRGRPTDEELARRAKKDAKVSARKVLGAKITVQTAKGPKKVETFIALVKKEVSLAADGDWRARKTIFDLAKWASIDSPDQPLHLDTASPDDLTATGQAIIDWFEEEIRGRDQDEEEGK